MEAGAGVWTGVPALPGPLLLHVSHSTGISTGAMSQGRLSLRALPCWWVPLSLRVGTEGLTLWWVLRQRTGRILRQRTARDPLRRDLWTSHESVRPALHTPLRWLQPREEDSGQPRVTTHPDVTQ